MEYDDGPTCPRCGENMRTTSHWGSVCDDCEIELESLEAELAEQESKQYAVGSLEHALMLDGEKLRQLTGEDHGPYFIDGDPA